MRMTAVPLLLIALLAFVAYACTAPIGVTWNHGGEDGAEFAAVGSILGVAHPTGYPLYSLLLRLASAGVVEPAWRATLVTNLAAAVAVFLLGLLFVEIAGRVIQPVPSTGESAPGRRSAAPIEEKGSASISHSGVARAAGFCLTLVFAATPLWWSQSNIIEVYALHVLFVALALLLATTLRGRERHFLILAYVCGLATAHHLQIVLLAPTLLIFVVADRRAAHRQTIDAGPVRTMPEPGLWIMATLLSLLPVALYLVLLLRSRLNPALDWGNPESLEQLLWVIRGEQYRFRMFSSPTAEVMERARQTLLHLLPGQFAWTGVPLGLIGIAALLRRREFTLTAGLSLYLLIQLGFALNYAIPDPDAYFIPVLLVWCAFSAAGAVVLIQLGQRGQPAGWVGLVLCLAGPAAMIYPTWSSVSLRNDTAAEDYAREAVAGLPRQTLVLSEGDGRTFGLWYRALIGGRSDLTVIYKALLVWPWYVNNLRERDPALVLKPVGQPPLEFHHQILTDNMGVRPVYTTNTDPWLSENFIVVPEGRLFRVLGERTPLQPPTVEVRSRPVDLGKAANAGYRMDPFTPGSVDSAGLYPGFGGGAIYWGELPFQCRRPAATTAEWSVISSVRRSSFSASLPLWPDSTRSVCILMDAGLVGRFSLRLGEARIHYSEGPPESVEIRSYVNVWDYHAESWDVCLPADAVAWVGPLDQSLTVLPITTDPGRVPVSLDLTGEGPEGEFGETAGFIIFGVTQVLE